MMVELAQWSLWQLPLLALIAIGAHLVVSGSQTLLHYSLGHHRLGGVFFRNHIRFHRTYYARGHLVSSNYRNDEGSNTPYLLVLTILVAGVMFFVLPLGLFLVVAAASAASFYGTSLTRRATCKDRNSSASPGSGTSDNFTSSITCMHAAIPLLSTSLHQAIFSSTRCPEGWLLSQSSKFSIRLSCLIPFL